MTRFPHELEWEAAKGVSSRWRELKSINLAISLYLGKEEVGVFVRGLENNANGVDVVNSFLPYAEELSEQLGVDWQRTEKRYFLISKYPANTANRSQWDKLADWLHRQADCYEAALNEIVGAREQSLTNEVKH